MKIIAATLVSCFLLLIFFDFSLNRKISILGFKPVQTAVENVHAPVPYGRAAGAFTAMLLGIVFGSVYERVRDIQGKIKFGVEVATALSSAHLYKSLLVAPLVFGGVYTASGTQPDIFVATLFAFQNGFFCHSIFLNKRKAETTK